MPLDPHQLKAVQEAALRADNNDPQALAFFAALETQGTPHAKMFLDARDEARADKAGGLPIDMGYVSTLGLLPHQIKDGIALAKAYAKGDAKATAFWNGAHAGVAAGSGASGSMLMLRDHVLEVLARDAAAAPAAVAVAPLAAPQVPLAAPQVPQASAGPLTPVGISSGVVVSLPPLNASGYAVIDLAIAESKLFNASSVKTLLDRVRALESEVLSLTALPTPPEHASVPSVNGAP